MLARPLSSERQIIERLRGGDTAALTSIMEWHTAALLRFARYLTKSPDVADDIVQQVFVQIWTHRTAIDPEHPIRPYLYRAVQNRVLDLRKAERVRERYQDEVWRENINIVHDPESQILTRTAIQAGLDQLAPRRRMALRLRFEGMTHAEIAAVLDISLTAAKSLVIRALTDLRDVLKGF